MADTTIPQTLSATSLNNTNVVNLEGENVGKIEDLMIDLNSGHVTYAVLSFGGVLGIGNKLFAVPLAALTLNTEDENFVMNVDKETLENAPGFDKDNWPLTVDGDWLRDVYAYYELEPYW